MKNIILLILLLFLSKHLAAESDENDLQEARQSLNQGEVTVAIIQLKNLLQTSPLNADARLLLGKSYLKLGNAESAVKEVEKARDLRLSKKEWIIPLAQAYLMAGYPGKVIDGLNLDDSAPEQLRGHLLALKGNANLQLGKLDLAQSDYDSALELDPVSSPAYLGKATLAFVGKRYEQASDFANKIIKIDQSNVEAWTILGELNRLNGRHQEGLDAFSKAIGLQPNNIKARVGRSVILISLKQDQKALEDINYILTNAGEIPAALYLKAVVEFQNNKLQEAEVLLVKVLNLAPNHLQSQLLLGTIAYSQNKLESADNYLSGYVRSVHGSLPAIKLLAAVKMKLKQPANAVQLLEQLESEGGSDPQYLALLGSAYLQNKEFDKGTEKLARAAELAPNVAAIHAQLALGQIASGKLSEAVVELENAVDLGQGLMQADVLLVMTLLQQKKYDDALKAAERLAKKTPSNPMPVNLMAAAYLAKGDIKSAEKYWNQALSINPGYFTAALNLAKLEINRNNPDEAIKWYNKILNKQPNNLNALIGLAQVAERNKNYKKMVKWLLSAREKNPDALEPLLMLTKYYLLTGKPLLALEIARDADSRHPKNHLALKSLGMAQTAAGQTSNALSSFRKLVERFGANPEYHYLLAQTLYKDGQTDAANSEWDKALEVAPAYFPAAVARAESALRQNEYKNVLEISKDIQQKHPNSPMGFQLEGDAELGLKHVSKAKAAYQQGYAIKPTVWLAQRLFNTYRALGDTASAFSVLEGWLEKAGNDVSSWTMLGMGYQEVGDKSKAISAYQKAHELAPENYVIVNNLAWLYQEIGDKKAIDFAEKLLDLAENDPRALDTVGWIYIQNNKEKRGLVLLQQAAVQAPHLPDIRVHLAEALIKTGRKDEARKELKRLLKEKKTFSGRESAERLLDSL